jgi:hypothetical protein
MKTATKSANATPTTHAYALFVDSLCEGSVPVEFDADGKPVLYPTLEAAQRVIAEDTIERLHQFLAGEREFEDAIHPEEYPCPVEVLPDGSLRPVTE